MLLIGIDDFGTNGIEPNIDGKAEVKSHQMQSANQSVNSKVTQMVHDLREQVLPQRFEDLRQKMVQVARAAPSCHQPQQAVRSTGIIRTVV
ncbi:hypothetical protein KIN20_036999 [Parelaphostrongylus tenuis]|uniref:Uncharacterized protein n=1 Tax=Parelaphostrongylus tenuis TaxID=148309 RepID=A0AAD5WM39_PARTN|nr:hypothetical protein KIN20_036999 [Parelaphostrongylus tenuis]